MIDGGRLLRISLSFALGFGVILWAGAAGLAELRGPRASILAELNAARRSAQLEPLALSPALGRAARWELRRIQGGGDRGLPSSPEILARIARERGWRGTGTPRALALAVAPGPEACAGALRADAEPGRRAEWLRPSARQAAIALELEPDGSGLCILIVA